MRTKEIVALALRTIERNKLRSSLTMLGIVIGVGDVICTVAIGQGASGQIKEQIQSLGENMIYVSAGSANVSGVHMGSQAVKSLVVGDATAVQKQNSTIAYVSPMPGTRGQLVHGGLNWFTRLNGVSPDYLRIRDWPLQAGANFTENDVKGATNVCVIGQTVKENLFANQDPVGQTVRVQNLPFVVVGVLSAKGLSPFGQDQDDLVMMPYTTVQKKIAGIDWLQAITFSADSAADIPYSVGAIARVLRQRHHLRPDERDDFTVQSANDIASAQEQTSNVMTLLLASIASIALLVGGIGIMNIMLVSVTERTHEVGLRMAVGATESDIERQFLSEALVLTMIGGFIGVGAGVFGSLLISRMFGWPTLISTTAILLATFFSVAIGIFFGFYPAYKAAHLDPIVALRAE